MPSPGAWLFLTHSRANVLVHLEEARFVGIPNGRPSVAVAADMEGVAAGKARIFGRRQAGRQAGSPREGDQRSKL